MSAGTVISVAEFSLSVLNEILRIMGDIERKIAVGLSNESGGKWTAIGVYFYSGASDIVLPNEVPDQMVALYNARKTSGPVATGAVGVLGYKLGDGNTLGVMFSVPYDYNLYSNWWNVKVYNGYKPVDKDMYDDLYDNATFKGDDQWYDKSLGYGYKVRGAMSSSGTCTLQCYINKE